MLNATRRTRQSPLVITLAILMCSWSPAQGIAETITSRYGGKFEIDTAEFRIFDIPRDQFEAATGMSPSIMTPERVSSIKTDKEAMATGKVLTILIEWENREADHNHAPEMFDSVLYSDGLYPSGSANDYYQENSYGVYALSGSVMGWQMQPGFYNGNYNISTIINTADPFVDFSEYDGDGNGKVDALWIVYAGTGQNETHDPQDIWPHAIRGANIPTDDGVIVERWSVQAERHLDGSIMSIRVFCHEYGHILGLPDLYDYDAKIDTVTYYTPNDLNDHPVNDWDVMGYGGYAIMNYSSRTCPTHYSAWSRMELGWVTPTIPPCLTGEYQLYNIEQYNTQSAFRVPISEDGLEYFLLEYRNPRSPAKFDHLDGDFSAYCPWFTPGSDTLDQGLLILHVDEHYFANDGPPGQAEYRVEVEDAGYNPAQPWNGTEYTEWWYPYEFQVGALFSTDDPGQTQFTPTSVPNSDGHTGPSGISIIVTGQNPDYMTLIINKELAPEIQPIAPVTVEVDDSIDVGIVATDPNCTTPGLSPGQLPAFAVLWDSSGGHGSLILTPTAADLGTWYAKVKATDGGREDSTTVEINVIPPACVCDCHGDADCDAVQTVIDVVTAIGVAFRNENDIVDGSCPPHGTTVGGRTDVDCSGATDVIDVVSMVDVAFRNADPATKICDPCQ